MIRPRPFPPRFSFLLLLSVLLQPGFAQVRNAPAGNSLPEAAPAAPPHAPHEHAAAPLMSAQAHDAFAEQVDLSRFRLLAVFDNGRAKIIDTLAREKLETIYGKRRWKDLTTGVRYDPVFTYLDLLLNKAYYADKPLIHVEVLPLRRQIVAQLLPAEQQEHWLKLGRLTPLMFLDRRMQDVVDATAADTLLAKARGQMLNAWFTFQQELEDLQLISPPPGDTHWLTLADPLPPALVQPASTGASAVGTAALNEMFHQLADAWQVGDAQVVNATLNRLSDVLPTVYPDSYPAPWRRQMEYAYNATRKFTIGYIAYFAATVLLLIGFGAERRWLARTGLALLVLGFLVHSAGFAVRGVLSGRWPIHNQFESFIALSWFAALVGLILLIVKRQLLYGAAAAALGTCALLIANTVDIPSKEMGQVAGILATSRILYVHVNVVIGSYALIALGFFVSLFYLVVHYFRSPATVQYAAQGLQADVPDAASSGRGQLPGGAEATLRDLDRAQMVVLQIAFWLLGVGILLGAYWADHAWGRWWAWDPKETWALITWIIYLIVIHVRLAARRPHLVTAWLSVVGFFVMLWTHWGVNLLLAGLHSYA